jgi:hypothetical protein
MKENSFVLYIMKSSAILPKLIPILELINKNSSNFLKKTYNYIKIFLFKNHTYEISVCS